MRVLTEGFEMGDSSFWNYGVVNYSASTSQKRSGNYSYGFTASARNNHSITPLTELYFRVALRFINNVDSSTQRIDFRDAGSNASFVNIRAESSILTFYVGTTLVGTGITVAENVWYLFEVYLKVADSGGRFVVKVDGVTLLDYTGDTKPSTYTTVGILGLGNSCYVDDIALNDTTGATDNSWCGDGHVIALFPNGDGDVTQLTTSSGTSHYQMVDEVPSDADVTYVESSVAGERDLYQIQNTGLSGVNINRVWVEATVRDTVAASGTIALGIKVAGDSERYSPNANLQNTYTRIIGSGYTTNPLTSSAWTIADIDSLQIGTKVG